jgi:hypothetical protein
MTDPKDDGLRKELVDEIDDDEEEEVAFLPFHALNEFMRDDYRLDVIRFTLSALPELPEQFRTPVERLTHQVVKVPGFRNSEKAPLGKRLRPTASAFEKSPALVVAILAAWAEGHPELRQQVFDLLIARGWDVLPPEADRTQLPGWLTRWPEGESFESIGEAFAERYPGVEANLDDISLMVVWLLVRLPYDIVSEDEDEAEETGSGDQITEE